MSQPIGPTPRQRAAHIADVMSDFLPRNQIQPLENQIAHAIESAITSAINADRAAQAGQIAALQAYCMDADNESMEQARTIRAQAVEIERLKSEYAELLANHKTFVRVADRWPTVVNDQQNQIDKARTEIRELTAKNQNQVRTIAQYRLEAEAARECLIECAGRRGTPLEPDEVADDLINDKIAAIRRQQGQP